MNLLIVGSRSINEFDLSEYIPDDTELIISGGAKGMDSIAEKYADSNNISKLILRPKYKLYGRAAPIKRNEEMVNIADAVLIIWDGRSNGAKYTAEYAKRKNKMLRIISIAENRTPKVL